MNIFPGKPAIAANTVSWQMHHNILNCQPCDWLLTTVACADFEERTPSPNLGAPYPAACSWMQWVGWDSTWIRFLQDLRSSKLLVKQFSSASQSLLSFFNYCLGTRKVYETTGKCLKKKKKQHSRQFSRESNVRFSQTYNYYTSIGIFVFSNICSLVFIH